MTLLGNRRHSDNVQGDLFVCNETIFDVVASQLMPVFEGAYKVVIRR